MSSKRRVSWKDSNLALIGSDLDHKIKAAAADGEEQWHTLRDGSIGTKIWRIEQFKVVPWPIDMYGKFHVGDSYIVLNSYVKDGSDTLYHDIHIWIGNESSQDEYGTAAYKMVEADEYLGGAPIQHRQVQGNETTQFRSYFQRPLVYIPGGTVTGFRKVEPSIDKPNLYRVKGTQKTMSLTQMETLKKSSLNLGDSFILFANKSTVWLWNGPQSNPDEKARANTIAERMCTAGTVVVIDHEDGDDKKGDDSEYADFWKYFVNDDDDDDDIQPPNDEDTKVESFAPILLRVIPGSEPEQIAIGKKVKFAFGSAPSHSLQRSLLDETDVFILDGGWEIFVWIGKDASLEEKMIAITQGDAYCKQNTRTADIPLSICKSGYESYEFKGYFV